jgi:hypothetical protein
MPIFNCSNSNMIRIQSEQFQHGSHSTKTFPQQKLHIFSDLNPSVIYRHVAPVLLQSHLLFTVVNNKLHRWSVFLRHNAYPIIREYLSHVSKSETGRRHTRINVVTINVHILALKICRSKFIQQNHTMCSLIYISSCFLKFSINSLVANNRIN